MILVEKQKRNSVNKSASMNLTDDMDTFKGQQNQSNLQCKI